MGTTFRSRCANLTIFSRLMLGNLVVLVLAAGVSLYAVQQLGHMREISRRIILVQNVLIERASDMTGALLSQVRYEKKFALLQDPTLYEGFLAAAADFDEDLGEAMTLADSVATRRALEQVRTLSLDYRRLVEEEIAALRAGRPVSGQEKETAANAAMEELSRLRNGFQQSILQQIKALDEAGARARVAVLVTTGAALLFGIGLSLGITRSIVLPLSRMRKKTAEIAEGVFEPDLQVDAPPEIAALAGAINSMCEKLKEVDRMKSDFYSLMSHELRTPLTSIREGTNMFLEGLCGKVTEKQREMLVIIAEESSRLIDLVTRLLELSKLESGVLPFHLSRAELPPLIARALRELAPLAEAKKIAIESAVEKLPPVSIEAERILQVLRNLLGNALKFTPEGGRVRVEARLLEGEVRVSVSDTGPGIPEGEIGIIFEKFRQASSTSPKVQGTGLGLAIVRHIVQAHGGRVWAESETGCGSTFIFTLPL